MLSKGLLGGVDCVGDTPTSSPARPPHAVMRTTTARGSAGANERGWQAGRIPAMNTHATANGRDCANELEQSYVVRAEAGATSMDGSGNPGASGILAVRRARRPGRLGRVRGHVALCSLRQPDAAWNVSPGVPSAVLRYHFPFATATNRFDPARARGDTTLSRLLAYRPGFEANWHDR